MTRPNDIAVFQNERKGHSVKMETNEGRQLVNAAIDDIDLAAKTTPIGLMDAVVLPRLLLNEIRRALVWAGDEVAQLTASNAEVRDNLRQSVKLTVKLSERIADLEDQLAEFEHAELLAEQRAEFHWAVR